MPSLSSYRVVKDVRKFDDVIRTSSIADIQNLFNMGVLHPFMEDVLGGTLLHRAAKNCRSDLCELLIQLSDQPTLWGSYSFEWKYILAPSVWDTMHPKQCQCFQCISSTTRRSPDDTILALSKSAHVCLTDLVKGRRWRDDIVYHDPPPPTTVMDWLSPSKPDLFSRDEIFELHLHFLRRYLYRYYRLVWSPCTGGLNFQFPCTAALKFHLVPDIQRELEERSLRLLQPLLDREDYGRSIYWYTASGRRKYSGYAPAASFLDILEGMGINVDKFMQHEYRYGPPISDGYQLLAEREPSGKWVFHRKRWYSPKFAGYLICSTFEKLPLLCLSVIPLVASERITSHAKNVFGPEIQGHIAAERKKSWGIKDGWRRHDLDLKCQAPG